MYDKKLILYFPQNNTFTMDSRNTYFIELIKDITDFNKAHIKLEFPPTFSVCYNTADGCSLSFWRYTI